MSYKPLKELLPQHRIAVGMKLAGTKHADIAESLNVTKKTVDTWMGDQLIKAEIERQTELAVTNIHEKIAGGVQVAIDTLVRMATAPGLDQTLGPESRLEALDKLLRLSPDTHPESHAPKQPGAGAMNVLNVMGHMPPDERRGLALEAARRLLEGKGTEVKNGGGNGKPE